MKNKFMTKALAVVLSASMALSLSSATALTANAAAKPQLAKKTVSVKAGKIAKNKLKAASYKAGWRITKATVKKTKVAKAKVKKNKKVVVLTGVQKGKSKVVVKLKNQKTGKAGKIKFTVKVKVDKVVIEEPVVETASIKTAKQLTYDSAEITFDKAIDATQVSIETVAINGSVGAATSVTIDAADATKAVVVYGYAENTEYTFSVTGLAGTASFSSGSYAVTDIKIADQTVEAGSDQPIVYSLVAGDVDVTKYSDYLNYVDFQFEGDFTTYSPDAAKPTINFDEKDKTATVTVTFNNGVGDPIVKTIKVTSTAATATEGKAFFATNLLKWYLVDTTSDSFGIAPEGNGTDVYFFAKDKNGKAIKFSDMEVTSSNENVATVNYEQGSSGKYYKFAVAPGGDQGVATISIKAIEYKGTQEVPSEYKFQVNAKEKNNNIYAVNAGATSITLFNGQYGNTQEIEMKPVNSLNEKVDASESIEVTPSVKDVDPSVITATWNGEKLKVSALGAPAGTYKVTVTLTGESGSNTKDIVKNVNVRVTDVLSAVYVAKDDNNKPDQVWTLTGSTISASNEKGGATVKSDLSANYKIEVGDLNITDISGSTTSKDVKLAVYVNSKPIGYLDAAGVGGYAEGVTMGKRVIAKSYNDPALTEADVNLGAVVAFVYSGSNYYSNAVDGTLYLGQMNKKEFTTKALIESANTIQVGGKVSLFESGNTSYVEYYGAGNQKNSCAKEGSYNVVVKYLVDTNKNGKFDFEDGKQLGNTAKFNVSYSLTMPNLEYNASASAENGVYVYADVDLVRAEDGASVSYATAKRDTKLTYKYADSAFGKGGLAKGDKIYAVKVVDKRGNSNANDMTSAGVIPDGAVEIHFIVEKTTTIKA